MTMRPIPQVAFDETNTAINRALTECEKCGCAVFDADLHDEWHAAHPRRNMQGFPAPEELIIDG